MTICGESYSTALRELRLEEAEFEDLMADVREKVGFTQELVCAELKGRLFDEV